MKKGPKIKHPKCKVCLKEKYICGYETCYDCLNVPRPPMIEAPFIPWKSEYHLPTIGYDRIQ